MARGYMTFDRETNILKYVPPWPPNPEKGDLWSKESSRGTLFRDVVSTTLGAVCYTDKLGATHKCSIAAFLAWCKQGAKLLRRNGKKVIYKE